MLQEMIKDFLMELRMKGSSRYTVKNYGYSLGKLVKYLESNRIDYNKIEARQVKRFRNWLVEQGLKPKTINAALSALKSFYDFLVEEGEILGNPVMPSRLRVKEGQALPDFMSAEELAVFSNWLKSVPVHVSLVFRTMLATGLRVSEAADLTPRDVVGLGNGAYVLRIRQGKGNKERYAPIMEAGVARELIFFKEGRPEDERLFGLSSHGVKWWARKCRLEAGINFHTHRCRHTVGTQLLQRGVPIDKVQDVLGHADIGTTRRYARTTPEAILELAAKTDIIRESMIRYHCLSK